MDLPAYRPSPFPLHRVYLEGKEGKGRGGGERKGREERGGERKGGKEGELFNSWFLFTCLLDLKSSTTPISALLLLSCSPLMTLGHVIVCVCV